MNLKIVFAGTPDFAACSLSALLTPPSERDKYTLNNNVIAIYTQPDRPAGRGKKKLESPVKQRAKQHGLPVFQPENLKTDAVQAELRGLQPDLMIVAAYGLLLPKAVLDIPRLGCINIHASLLPRWRGAAPVQRAIQAGDDITGITIMLMNEGLDTGDILLRKELPILPSDTGGSLHDKLAALGAEALQDALAIINITPLAGEPQNNQLAIYASKLSKQEAQIDWAQDAETIERTVRAFNPWPMAYTLEEKTRIRLLEVDAIYPQKTISKQPGIVLRKNKNEIMIQCGHGQIVVKSLQFPGGKALLTNSFINGNKTFLQPGTQLISPSTLSTDPAK